MSKQYINRLAAIMISKGIEHVVVSPGSRNAPVIITFGASKRLKMVSVADERSAAFFALGIALQTGKTVAILCTSGSAVLNYAPGIAEAYYQKVPLLIITADRPVEWIDQGDSQTIRQSNVYSNYIRKSFNLPVWEGSSSKEWVFDRMVNEAIDRTIYPVASPVHINLPIDEPLYELDNLNLIPKVRIIDFIPGNVVLSQQEVIKFQSLWESASAKMIIVGQMRPDNKLLKGLEKLASDPSVVIFTESTSNLSGIAHINCIDRTLAQVGKHNNDQYKPEILLSIGGAVISKKIKAMLREMKPIHHWHVSNDTEEFHFDTYQSLTATIACKVEEFVEKISEGIQSKPGNYASLWHDAAQISEIRHQEYMKQIPFCDMSAYHTIFNSLPPNSKVHLANSTPVRYAQLFNHSPGINHYSNRGTSGIDGCLSTAAGFAFTQKGYTFLITGDIGFFYDSNALWNDNLNPLLRIILINNGGGNIFRIIDGPSNFDELEPFIETRHHLEAKGLATNFNINYYRSDNKDQLISSLPVFYGEQTNNRPALLEIITPPELSADVLKDYFKFLRS